MNQQTKRQNVPVWFEIPASDFGRAVKFYERLFGTSLKKEKFGPNEIAVFPHAESAVGGCVMSGQGCKPGADGPVVYLNADPLLDPVLARVGKAGGRVALPRTALPEGMGFFALIEDTEGNRVGLHALA